MPFFWYIDVNGIVFEGVIFDGSLEDTIADLYYWEQIGIINSNWRVDYES